MSLLENGQEKQKGEMFPNMEPLPAINELSTTNNNASPDGSSDNKLKRRPSRRRMSVPHQVNQQFLQEINQNLNENQIQHVRKASQEFRYERDLKHTLIKLQEKEDQCRTAVEIIGNLEKQLDESTHTIENLKNQLTTSNNETKILEQNFKQSMIVMNKKKKNLN